MKKLKLYFEASPLIEDRMSGIGHALLEIIRALEDKPECGKSFDIYLVVGLDMVGKLSRWNFKHAKYKKIPCYQRVFNLAWKLNIIPPMDIILGKGIYIFPNYKNWRLTSSKSITYVHDISFVLYPEFVSPKNQKFLEKNMPKWLRRTTRVVADSNSARDEIIKYYDVREDKVSTIYHGVDTEVFYKRKHNDIKKVKDDLGIVGEYIFYLGNIEPRKNIVRLIEAYEHLPDDLRDNYSLVIVGGLGWLNQPILDKIKDSQEKGFKVLVPTKYVEDTDLPILDSGATILCHPAMYEGFGLSLLQAMACGCPVIAGNSSSMPEIVGDAGLYVNAKDPTSISDTMKRLLLDRKLRTTLSENGVKRASKFSWEASTDKLLVLINEIS